MKISRSLRRYFSLGRNVSNAELTSKPWCIERFLRSAVLVVWFAFLFVPFAYCQTRAPLTVDHVSALLKGGVSSRRIAQLIRENGVGFKLDEKSLKRLKQEGASNDLLMAIKKTTTPRPPPPGKTDPRCHEILARIQLGEVLSSDERKILEGKCS